MRELSAAEAAEAAGVVATLVTVAALLWWWPFRGSAREPASGGPSWPALPPAPQESSTDPRETALGDSGLLKPAPARRLLGRVGRRGPPGPPARAPTTDEVAGSMVLLAVAVQSGCGLVEAVEAVVTVAPPAAARELAVVAAALRWGVSDDQAWAAVSAPWSRTAVALRLARVSGVAPSSLLLSGAEDLRAARLAAVEEASAGLGVRLVVPLGVAFLPAFVLTTVVPVVLAVARQVLQP